MREPPAYHLIIRRKGIGDTVAATPLVRDLHRLIPDIRLSVEGTLSNEVFLHDRRVGPRIDGAEEIVIDYKPTHDRGRFDKTARYLDAGLEDFKLKTGLSVPPGSPRPELVLSHDEQKRPDGQPYIVIASGVKFDMPVKRYPHNRWCEIVRLGRLRGWSFKQVGLLHDHRYPHIQEPIPGAENLLGGTGLRDLFTLIAHAEAVVCHVSLPMLVASAFGTPCVAIGGGRENPWLFNDMGVDYLGTIGQLSCCSLSGCHACFATTVHDLAYPPGTVCADPVAVGDGSHVGRCMTLIEPEEVVERLAVLMAKNKSVR